jgi:hypothetical protein
MTGARPGSAAVVLARPDGLLRSWAMGERTGRSFTLGRYRAAGGAGQRT